MTWRPLVLAAVLSAGAAGCAVALYLSPSSVAEYDAVKVRIYYGAGECRVEVVAATETIQTRPTRCARVPHRLPAAP